MKERERETTAAHSVARRCSQTRFQFKYDVREANVQSKIIITLLLTLNYKVYYSLMPGYYFCSLSLSQAFSGAYYSSRILSCLLACLAPAAAVASVRTREGERERDEYKDGVLFVARNPSLLP